MVSSELEIVARARDQLGDLLPKISKELKNMESVLGKAGGAMGTANKHAGDLQGTLGSVRTASEKARGGLGGLVDTLGKLGLAGMGISALAGAARGLGDALGIGLNVEIENVEASLVAFTKDGAKAKEILAQIRKEADSTPFAFNEMAKATAGLMPVAKTSGAALMDLVKQAEILAASNPAQGLEGAAFALREAVSGDFTSVIERFNLPRSYINKLKDEGVPALKIVSRAMLEMGYDADLVSNLAKTASGRWSTFKDTIDGVKAKVSKPLFDQLKVGLEEMQDWLDANKEKLDEWAKALGDFIGRGAVDAVKNLEKLLKALDDASKAWAGMSSEAQGGLITIAALMVAGGPILGALAGVGQAVYKLATAFQFAALKVAVLATVGMAAGAALEASMFAASYGVDKWGERFKSNMGNIGNEIFGATDKLAAMLIKDDALLKTTERIYEVKKQLHNLESDEAELRKQVGGETYRLGQELTSRQIKLTEGLNSVLERRKDLQSELAVLEGNVGGQLITSAAVGANKLREMVQEALGLKDLFKGPERNKMQSAYADMDEIELAFLAKQKVVRSSIAEGGKAVQEQGGKAKKAAISMQDYVQALISTHPATITTASATQLWQSRISDVNLALVANKDQIKAAQAAQATLSNTLQGAQSIYQGIQDKLSGLNQLLSESKQRLSELSAPRLAGMSESEKKIAILEAQLKRIQHWKELGFTHPGAALEAMPIDIEGAKEFIATLGGAAFTQEGLSGLIAQFRSLHSIKFDEQLRKLKESAEDVKPELTFEKAMKGIRDTKTTIGDLTGQIKAQESAMRLQQDAIKGIESAMKSQQGVINDLQLAGEQLNTTLGTYQDELRGAEKQQRLVNEALSDAYKWLLDDKQKMAEMGGEAANQALVIEAKTRALLTAINEFAKGTASTVKSNLAEAVQTYKDDVAQILAELAKIELGRGGTFGITPNVRKTPALAAGGIVTRPTLALIGEAGPEAVIPLSRGGGGGGFVWTGNVIVQGTVVTERELAETVRRELLKVKGRNTSTGL